MAFTEFSVTSRSCTKVIPSMAREKCWRTLQWHAFYDKATLASQKDSIWARFTLMRRNNHSQIPVAIDATVLRQSNATYIQTLSPHSSLPGLCNVIVSTAWEKISKFPSCTTTYSVKQSHRDTSSQSTFSLKGNLELGYYICFNYKELFNFFYQKPTKESVPIWGWPYSALNFVNFSKT